MMTTYLLLFKDGNLDQDDQVNAWDTWIGKLARAGKFISGKPFGPKARIVAGPQKLVLDFVLKPGDVTGYILIETETMDEALEIAKHAPNLLNGGTVEVRSTIPPPQ